MLSVAVLFVVARGKNVEGLAEDLKKQWTTSLSQISKEHIFL
jgi:hypothetical protein